MGGEGGAYNMRTNWGHVLPCSVERRGGLWKLWGQPSQLISLPVLQEKKDKVVLQAEVALLRQNNQRLQEESHTANEQLRRFAEVFSSAVEKEEL